MPAARELIITLGLELSEERDKAFELWTRLPSYNAAERAHGDYASNFCPSVRDILIEAATFISHGLAPTPAQMESAGDFYRCPCGEDHSGSAESISLPDK